MFKKIASNALSQVLSKVFTAVISIFMIGVLTKYFSPEWYGEYNKVYNYLWIFAFLADLGLYTLTIREISKDTSKAEKIIWNMMSLRLILWVLVMVWALWIAFFLPSYSSTATLWGIVIVAFFTVFNLLNSSVLSLMQSFMKIEFSLFSTVISRTFQVLLMIGVLFVLFPKSALQDYQTPYLLILWCGTLGAILNYFLNYYYAKRLANIRFLWDFSYMKEMFLKSLSYGLALFLSVVYFKIDVMILSLLEPQSIANHSIAMYSLPMKIVEVLMVIGVFYLNSVLPHLSDAFHQNNLEKTQDLLSKSFLILLSFGMFVFVMWLLFQEHIIRMIATPEYLKNEVGYSSLDVFWIVLWVLVFYFISSLMNYIFIASKNETQLLYVNAWITVFNILGNILVIPQYSFIGAGIVTLLSQVVLFVTLWILSRKIIKIPIAWGKTLQIFACSIIVFFLGKYLLENISLWLYWDFFLLWTLICSVFLGSLFLILRKNFWK